MANVANLLDLRFVNEANVFNYGKRPVRLVRIE
jgi:hypothetical protein